MSLKAFRLALSEGWQLGLSIAIVSICLLVSLRQILGWRALRALRRLAIHSYAIQHCFELVSRIPADALLPDIHRTVSKILWHHLGRAAKRRPGHPHLNALAFQIAKFSGQQTPTRSGHSTRRADVDTLTSLYDLEAVFTEAYADKIIDTVEHFRAVDALTVSAARLETELLKRKALSATHLQRNGEALTYLKSALQSASKIPQGEDERRALGDHIASLESAY